MTHTHRKTNNVDRDFYATPPWPVRLLLDQEPPGFGLHDRTTIGEPCCGRGDICDVLTRQGHDVVAGDVRPLPQAEERYDAGRVNVFDPCASDYYEAADCIVTNPPYSADTGTAGSVMEAIVEWQKPTAALLSASWIENCRDRRWAWSAEDWRRPCRVLVLPRVEYEYPGDEKSGGSPGPSMWVLWHPAHDGSKPTLEHFTPADQARYQGQTSLLEVAE